MSRAANQQDRGLYLASDDSDSDGDSASSVEQGDSNLRFGGEEGEEEVDYLETFEELPSDEDSDEDSGSDSDGSDDGPGLSLAEQVAAAQARGRVNPRLRKRPRPTSTSASTSTRTTTSSSSSSSIKLTAPGGSGEKDSAKKKKKSKHAPATQSSSRAAFYARGAPLLNNSGTVSIGKVYGGSVDPRFSEMSGDFDADKFGRTYGFLDDMADKEIRELKAKIKGECAPPPPLTLSLLTTLLAACGVTGKKGQKERKKLGVRVEDLPAHQERLKSMLNARGERRRASVKREAEKAVKSKINEHVAKGGKRYYLKKREMKAATVEAKFEELRKRGDGAVRKALERRRVKNSQKDRRRMPPKKK